MANKLFGIADPYYDALRVQSNQAIWPDAGGGSGSTGGTGLENKIYLWPADGSTITTFDPDQVGLIAALAAATSGDTVWLPSITIALTAGITVGAGVVLRGISPGSVLSFSGFSGTAITMAAGTICDHFDFNFTPDSGSGFPTTPILDDFNRANEGPPPSASWANSLNYGLKVVSNQMAQAQTNALCDSRYLTSYGQEAEVYVDLVSSVAGLSNQEFWLFTGLDYGSGDSFYAIFDVAGQSVKLYDSGVFKNLHSFTFSAGDSLGLQITGTSNPVFHVWHKPLAGSWTEVHTYTYTGGTSRAGLLAITSWGTNVFDNFGGGDVGGVASIGMDARFNNAVVNHVRGAILGTTTGSIVLWAGASIAPLIIDSDFSAAGTTTIGIEVTDNALIYQSRAAGTGYDLQVDVASEARVDDVTLINATQNITGTLTPLRSDRAVWDTTNFAARHAKDISDAASKYHLLNVTTQTYTVSNPATDRAYDVTATTLNELAKVVGTLIADLRAKGLLA